jgi:prevent-host-death family protein
MREFASTEAKDKWGLISDTALQEPVTITRHGRPSLVVTSVQDYQDLQRAKYRQLKADIQEGLDDLEHGRVGTKTIDAIIAEGKARLKLVKPKPNANAKKSAAR